MKSISDIINKLPTPLQEFLRKPVKKRTISDVSILHKLLGTKLAGHCQITYYQHGQLKLVVDSAIYYSQIYYHLPELTKQLKQIPNYADLQEIKCSVARSAKKHFFSRVVAPNLSATTGRPPNRLSDTNEKLWRQLIQQLKKHTNN